MKTMPCEIKFKSRGPKWHPGPPGGRQTIKGGEKEAERERDVRTERKEEERG